MKLNKNKREKKKNAAKILSNFVKKKNLYINSIAITKTKTIKICEILTVKRK